MNLEASVSLQVEIPSRVVELDSGLDSRPGILVCCTQRTRTELRSGFLKKSGVSVLLVCCFCLVLLSSRCFFVPVCWQIVSAEQCLIQRLFAKITTNCCECVDPFRFRFRLVGAFEVPVSCVEVLES